MNDRSFATPRVGIVALATFVVLSVLSPAGAQVPPALDEDASSVMVKLDRSFGALDGMPVDTRWRAAPIRSGETVEGAIERLSDNSLVIEIAPNLEYEQLGPPPNDPYFSQQWHLADIGVLSAWDQAVGTDITVAVVDGGVSAGGLDLACRSFVDPFDASTGASGPNAAEPNALDGHGTLVAGTIAQCTDNGIGAAGVAPEASIMPVRVADTAGSFTSAYLANGIIWAADHGAEIVNISLGITGGCSTDWPACGDAVVDDALSTAAAAGVLIVASAGNDGNGFVTYPANHPDVIAVGATTIGREQASFSDSGSALSLMAPGEFIYQESFDDLGVPSTWGVHAGTGTSYSAPQVAGVAALMMSANSALTAGEVDAMMAATALDLGTPGWDSAFGSGLVQADAAVAAAVAAGTPDDVSTILGGLLAVNDSVAIEISALTGSVPERLGGSDRYATAVAISASEYPSGAPTVYIATGLNFPDALSIGPVAARTESPVLLVRQDEIPSVVKNELSRLGPTDIIAIGGTEAVSDRVLNALSAYASSGSAQRISGPSRYDTSAEISRLQFPPGTDTVYVATGEDYPDALAAGAAVALDVAPILLTPPDRLHPTVRDEIIRLAPSRVVLVGGLDAVGDAVMSEIAALGPDVRRVGGADRYATAAAVSQDAFSTAPAPTFVASGVDFPDAVVGGPLAGRRGGPILLSMPDRLPASSAAEIDRLANDQP